MENTIDPLIKNSKQKAFGGAAGAVTSSLTQFLQSFKANMAGVQSNVSSEMLCRFLTLADQFSNDCSHQIAAVLREHSSLSEVRETTEDVLSRLVRNRCFEALDSVLESYIEFLGQLNLDLKVALAHLADSRLRDAVQSTTAGQGKEKRFKLPTAAKTAALLKISDYLKSLESLPIEILDYVGLKLTGPEADFTLQRRFTSTVQAATNELLQASVSLIEDLEAVKRRRWEEQTAAESAAINAVAMISSQKSSHQRSGAGAFLLGTLFASPVGYISATGTRNLYIGLVAALFGLTAIFFFYRGVLNFTKR